MLINDWSISSVISFSSGHSSKKRVFNSCKRFSGMWSRCFNNARLIDFSSLFHLKYKRKRMRILVNGQIRREKFPISMVFKYFIHRRRGTSIFFVASFDESGASHSRANFSRIRRSDALLDWWHRGQSNRTSCDVWSFITTAKISNWNR